MTLSVDTHVKLAAGAVKKNAVVGTGAVVPGADELAIRIGDALSLGNIQQIVGSFIRLRDFALTNIKDYTADTTFSMPPGGAYDRVVTTGHSGSLLSLYVGTAILTGDKSHYLDATFKLLIARLLEEAK